MKKQQGFTLIELIAVVVILGFLAATAIPKFMNATDDAKSASIEGVAGGISSAVGLVRSQWE
jgi:MSHA pilin protein MshB